MKRYRGLIAWLPLLYTLGVTGFLLVGPVYASSAGESADVFQEIPTLTKG